MPKHFMIFYREIDHQHYLYNGEWPIGINPRDERISFGQFTPDDSGEQWITNTEKVLPLLEDILNNARKRSFIINKLKYMIIHRGTFVED